MGIRVLELNVHAIVVDRNDKLDRKTISCQIVNTGKVGFSQLDWFLDASMAIYDIINWETKYLKMLLF